jgi:uncharacterized protein YejL (UPF0352 family)
MQFSLKGVSAVFGEAAKEVRRSRKKKGPIDVSLKVLGAMVKEASEAVRRSSNRKRGGKE